MGRRKPAPTPTESGCSQQKDEVVKAALLLFRDDNGERRLLFVRNPAKPYWLFPGGKRESGESIEDALRRELWEELSIDVTRIEHLGAVSGQTPEGAPLMMHLFSAVPRGEPRASSEIDRLIWAAHRDLREHRQMLTPITTERVLPFLSAAGLW